MYIIKDCAKIWSRLFDHQSFINSEVNSFVKEFEEKRSDREVETLLNTLNIVCEINNHCDKISSNKTHSLELLNEKITNCLTQACQTLEEENSENLKNIFEIRRQEREQKWHKFKKSMEPKYIEVDVQFLIEQETVKKIYGEKEKNLLQN